MTLQNWQTLKRERVWQGKDGKFLIVENHSVQLPTGQVIEGWPWVISPDYVNVVAETSEGKFLCFRQTKYGVHEVSLGIPGGYLEPNEDPLQGAQRELLEETGYHAETWINLGRYVVDGNRGCGHANLFLARNAVWQQPIEADDLEEQFLLLLTQQELAAALAAGDIKVLSWATAVSLALSQI